MGNTRSPQPHLCPTYALVNPPVAQGQGKRVVTGILLRGTHLQGHWPSEVPQAITFLPSSLSKMHQANGCQNAAIDSLLSLHSAGQIHPSRPPASLSSSCHLHPGTQGVLMVGLGRGQLHSEQEVESEPEGPSLAVG